MHKTSAAALLATSLMTWAAPASAQTDGGFEIAFDLSDYNYRERDEGEGVRDDGLLYGGQVSYVETLGSGGWFVRGLFNFASGKIDYLETGEGTRIDGVRQNVAIGEVHVGKDFAVGKNLVLTPYVGVGSRILSDYSGDRVASDGLLGYDREINFTYAPIGLAAGFSAANGARFVLGGQYNGFVGGNAESKLSDIDTGVPGFTLPDLDLDIDEGDGYEIYFNARLPVRGGRSAVTVTPYVRGWSIDRSESFVITNPDDPTEAIEFFEPRNDTTRFGLRIGYAF